MKWTKTEKAIVKPEELSGLAVFFASAASDFVTGQIVAVDGGWMANL